MSIVSIFHINTFKTEFLFYSCITFTHDTHMSMKLDIELSVKKTL